MNGVYQGHDGEIWPVSYTHLVVEIEPENVYAGVEIGLACPDSVAVTASSGSSGSMSAGPVLANGSYWTSFFESDNKLSGDVYKRQLKSHYRTQRIFLSAVAWAFQS